MAIALTLGPAAPCHGQELQSVEGEDVLLGESPRLVVTGLKPKERVTLHADRVTAAQTYAELPKQDSTAPLPNL